MALSDGSMTLDQLEQLEREHAKREQELRIRREAELARASDPRQSIDGNMTRWTYSVIDGSFARIDRCETGVAHLVIPSELDSFPVLALGDGACAKLESVESISCPPAMAAIGRSAFQLCRNLRSIEFPAHVDDFDASWLDRCANLEEIVLPGRLEQIPASVFGVGHLVRLMVGASAWAIEPGAFEHSELQSFAIDPANPHLATDGIGVYSADGLVLWALARPVGRYEVCDGCECAMPKAAYGVTALKHIDMPASLKRIGELAFARSGIERFDAPASLTEIGRRAFQGCQSLASADLNEGLLEIGDSAFEGTGLDALVLPSSVREIGKSAVRNTNVALTGPEATFAVQPQSHLAYDGRGGLYRRTEHGLVFEQMLDERVRRYPVLAGTCAIADGAFERNPGIEKVFLPEGIVTIGDRAFKNCRRLREAILPASAERVGAEAFSGTRLERLVIPAGLRRIGDMAFAAAGRIGADEPSLREIQVDPRNKAFVLRSGLLCEKVPGGLRVIAFDNAHDSVQFPEEVLEIAPYALCNARGIRELRLSPNIREVGTGGLAIWSGLKQLTVSVASPVEGRHTFRFSYPKTVEAVHAASTALGGYDFVNIGEIARLCDKAILMCHNYVRPDKGAPSAYEQALLAMARLSEPVLMRKTDRKLFEQLLEVHLVEICVDIARHDDRRAIDQLADLGFLNADNIEAVTGAVGKLQDAAMTAHLLEMKRRRFERDPFDFEI